MTADDAASDILRPDDADALALAAAARAGDDRARERLARLLTRHARLTARAFLAPGDPEADDLAQDAVIAVLGHLERRPDFTGSLVNFTIVVTRNRCRNWLQWRRRRPDAPLEDFTAWLAADGSSPLDLLVESEIVTLLRRSLAALDALCRDLLRAMYLEGRSAEELRVRAGLTTVQSIYYRRARCLEKAGSVLKKRLADCSSPGQITGGGTSRQPRRRRP